jgi:transcriptional regulator with GAF, ATPase, and Fis domain
VFLDEVGELPLDMQPKLLRVLEGHEVRRVGGTKTITVDLRVVAATNRDLTEEVRQGRFRQDLYYRLNVVPITLPPLRQRAVDIPLLVNYYVDSYNTEFRKRIRRVSPAAMEQLKAYTWPGNVRELRNAVERAMLLVEGDELTSEDFPVARPSAPSLNEAVDLPANGIDLEQLERSLVIQALERSGWNQTRAAGLLGVNRDQIRYRIEKFKLERPKETTP